jgi:thiamine kinase-like enzyme
MKQLFLDALLTEYGLRDVLVSAAPRQLVAETFIVSANNGQRYFCKLIDKPLFIPKVIASLPVLDAMHDLGFERINYPIKTLSGALHLMIGKSLMVLYNYIEASQSYEYDNQAFGRLLGQVHALTPRINADIPKEPFAVKHGALFEEQFDQLVSAEYADPVMQGLQRLLRQQEAAIRRQFAALQRSIAECSTTPVDLMITHGDAGGNLLVKSPADLYLIDWDEILLAPRERDLWIYDSSPEFMRGYRSVFPDYQANQAARRYCLCSQHFDYMAYYLAEITGDFPQEYRASWLREFENYFEGWIKPFIAEIT